MLALSSLASSDTVNFLGSQTGGKTVINYSYTDNPVRLMYWDVITFFRNIWALPYVVMPLTPTDSGDMCEMAPTWRNIFCILVHAVLFFLQMGFLLFLPPVAFFVPLWTTILIVSTFMTLNIGLTRFCLNGKGDVFHSDPKLARPDQPQFADEQWVFLNGVAVGSHWMQSNLDRLALTFGRPVEGIHNRTSGIIFDIIECLIQRNFTFATRDIRLCYRMVKEKLYNPQYKRVVFVLHSQGGIEGGMVVDWLLQELPQNLLNKLEVYTFGNAANHFNNPHRTMGSQMREKVRSWTASMSLSDTAQLSTSLDSSETRYDLLPPTPTTPSNFGTHAVLAQPTTTPQESRAIRHIEHYAFTTDFVALWGVVYFSTTRLANNTIPRFMGRLFERKSPNHRGGHQLCQHYLDGMFPLEKDPRTGKFLGCKEDNPFMESVVTVSTKKDRDGRGCGGERETVAGSWESDCSEDEGEVEVEEGSGSPIIVRRGTGEKLGQVKVKELSRLWKYRNGKSPVEDSPWDSHKGFEGKYKVK